MNIKHPFRSASAALLLTSTSLLASTVQAAVVVANFTDGNGTSSADQFQGTAGSGWSNAWSFTGSDYAATVLSTKPMDGNYLNITRPSSSTAGALLTRTIDNEVLNTAKQHVIEFSLRLDTLNPGQSISIGGYSSGATSAWNWLIVGETTRWALYNGLTLVNVTGLTPIVGHTYDFALTINMEDKQWTVVIRDGESAYTSNLLAFRNAAPVNDQRLQLSITNTSAQNIGFSIDSISYTTVPEPGITALLAIGGVFGAVRKLRRTRSSL